MLFLKKARPEVNTLRFELLNDKKVEADVLRLDTLDPVVSGNKWFKLKEYVLQAIDEKKTTIVTFGGAFSNHIVATAAFCKQSGLKSVGIIRGEKAEHLSPTLQEAVHYGMDLFFLGREKYKQKEIPSEVHHQYSEAYFINEGGYGFLGMRGAASILDLAVKGKYTHILTAVGTGTTLAGLIEASDTHQKLIGISVLKNNLELEIQINHLLSTQNKNRFTVFHQFHCGGYAKHHKHLIDFMNDWFRATGIPTDFVYTGKMFYAFHTLLAEEFFPAGSKILLVHTGGLQGNNSLKKGTLIF